MPPWRTWWRVRKSQRRGPDPAPPMGTGNGAGRILGKLDKAKSVHRIISLNARFHEALYAPTQRERTLAMIRALRLNFERYLRFTWEETPHLNRSLTQSPSLDNNHCCDQLQGDTECKGSIIVASPAANDADEYRTKRAKDSADCVRQPHDDNKACGSELAVNDQRRQGYKITH